MKTEKEVREAIRSFSEEPERLTRAGVLPQEDNGHFQRLAIMSALEWVVGDVGENTYGHALLELLESNRRVERSRFN